MHLEPKLMSLNDIFCPANSPNPPNSSCAAKNDKEKQKILHLRSWNQHKFLTDLLKT